jgi:hypothetical protein
VKVGGTVGKEEIPELMLAILHPQPLSQSFGMVVEPLIILKFIGMGKPPGALCNGELKSILGVLIFQVNESMR